MLALQLSHNWPTYFDLSRLAEDVDGIVVLLKSHPHALFAHQVEKMLGSVLLTRPGGEYNAHPQNGGVLPSTDVHEPQSREAPFTDTNNAFPDGIFDFPYFGTSEWSFDPVNLDNVELW